MNEHRPNLAAIRVVDVMSQPAVFVGESDSLAKAAQILAEHNLVSAPVVNVAHECVGMLSATDLARGWAEQVISAADGYVHNTMSRNVRSVQEHDLLLDAAQKMQQASLHRMPVLRNKKAVGVISSSDIIAAFLKAQPHSRTADASAWRADCKATS